MKIATSDVRLIAAYDGWVFSHVSKHNRMDVFEKNGSTAFAESFEQYRHDYNLLIPLARKVKDDLLHYKSKVIEKGQNDFKSGKEAPFKNELEINLLLHYNLIRVAPLEKIELFFRDIVKSIELITEAKIYTRL